MEIIKVKRIHDAARVPVRAHATDACFDIFAVIDNDEQEVYILPGETYRVHTGIITEIPRGYHCQVYARSGMGITQGLRLANSVGIIDSDYRGEWIVALHNDSDYRRVVKTGDRVAQFMLCKNIECKLQISEDLESTERGAGGLGSTGI